MQYENNNFYADLLFQGIRDKSAIVGNVVAATVLFGAVGGAIMSGVVLGTGMNRRTKLTLYTARFNPEIKSFRPIRRLQ